MSKPDAAPRLKRAPGFGPDVLAPSQANGQAGVVLRETLRDIVQISERQRGGDRLAKRLQSTFRLPLPDTGKSAEVEGLTIIGTAPRVWRILSAPLPPGELARRLKAAAGADASIVDIGHGLATLEASGPGLREALARLCRLDLDPAVFSAGDAAETIMAQMPVMLWRKATGDVFGLAVPLTFAHSFAHALTEACRPFGLFVEPIQD